MEKRLATMKVPDVEPVWISAPPSSRVSAPDSLPDLAALSRVPEERAISPSLDCSLAAPV